MLEQYHFLKCEEQFFSSNIINSPHRGLRQCATSWKVAGSIFDGVIGSGFDSASNRNEYQQGYHLKLYA